MKMKSRKSEELTVAGEKESVSWLETIVDD